MRIDYPRRGRTGVPRWVPSWRQLLALVALAVAGLVATVGIGYAVTDVPDPNEDATAQTSIVTWSNGAELGRFGGLNRVAVKLADQPVHVKYAVLAAEDRNFYSNRGVSVTSVVRSAWHNLTSETTQGGSTLTQQYVKNVYLTQDRTLGRKAREFFLALKVDGQLSKNEILESYLNTIYWGRSAYGIETAAQAYFGVSAAKLSVSQAAYLAGIIQAPGSYNPTTNPEGARARWDYVLDGMVEKGWLSAADRAEQEFPTLVERRRENRLAGSRGYLLDTVRRELLAHGFTDKDIDLGGLRITTTFGRNAQRAAQAAVEEGLAQSTPKDIDLHVALAAVRPGDGGLVAMYGGKDYLGRQFNDATQGAAQPGSTFKPFALAAALRDGIGLRSEFDGDSGRSFDEYADGRPVPNFGNQDYGHIDLMKATADSVNTVYVELGLEVGPRKVVDAAVRAGIPRSTADLNANPSVVLGVANTRPVDLANAYATLAAQGVHAPWYVVKKVTDPAGSVVYEAKRQRERVFPKGVMADVSYALQGVVENGSGFRARELGRPSAGKTGTTNDNRSAWYAGYVPQLAAVVGMWDESERASLSGYGGLSSVTGGSYPARIWTAFMSGALDGTEERDFPEPAFVGRPMHVRPSAPPTPRSPSPTSTESPSPSPTESPSPTDASTERPGRSERGRNSPTPSKTARAGSDGDRSGGQADRGSQGGGGGQAQGAEQLSGAASATLAVPRAARLSPARP